MTVHTFYLSTEENKKRRFPNLSEDSPGILVIKKRNLKGDEGFTKFQLLSLNQRFNQFCAYDLQGNCYIIDLDKNIYWCLKNQANVTVIEFLQFHPKLSFGYVNGLIKIFDLESGKLFGTFNGHTKPVKKISFNHIGDQCVSISDEKGFVWDPFTFKKIFLIEPFESSIMQQAVYIPWHYKFIVQTSDNVLSVWHSRKGSIVKKFHALELLGNCISSFSFKKNGSAMVACGDCNKLLYLHTSSWKPQKVFILPHKYTKLKFIEFISHPHDIGESTMVSFLTHHNDVVLFDLIRDTILTVVPMDQDYCASLGINISGKYLLCLMDNGSICIIKNELWNDQDINPKQDIYDKTSQQVHKPYKKIFKERHRDILNIISSLGQFPSDLRPFIWRKILSLPMNSTAYRYLCKKGFHNAFSNVLEYPSLPTDLRFPVLRLLSNLAFWCPLFQHNNCLPLMILRFSKLFKSSPMVAFEVVTTILVNYCQNWFSEFPLVSKEITNYIETVIKIFDIDLWNYFNKFGIPNTAYVCPIIETLFAEVLFENDWLVLWDNVLTSKTFFLTLAVAALYIVNKNLFLSCKSKKEFEFCTHNPVNFDIRILIKKTKEMGRIMKLDSDVYDFIPLKKGDTYQILNESMKPNKVLTLETISNSENASMTRKIMELCDKLEGEQPDSCFLYDKWTEINK